MIEKYEDIEKFLELDLKIKNLIIKMKPERLNYGEEYYFKYVEELIDYLDRIQDIYVYFIEFLKMNPFIKDIIKEKFENIKSRILNCNYDIDRLQIEYEKLISSMTPGIDKIINGNFIAYSILKNEAQVFSKCNTVNDMLHAFHQYLVNDQKFYNDIPVIDFKQNPNNKNIINLRGRESIISKNLFDNISPTMDCSTVDILSLNDTILIMCKDLGHALSVEIHEEGENLRVNYFIPKVCNVEKVNKLKGVTKLDPKTSDWSSMTNGEFLVNRNNYVSEIVEFLKSVPSDADIKIDFVEAIKKIKENKTMNKAQPSENFTINEFGEIIRGNQTISPKIIEYNEHMTEQSDYLDDYKPKGL